MEYSIREILPQDNAAVERLVRVCLTEFGGNREGFAWADPDLGRFSEVYDRPGRKYWVALDPAGELLGGAGVGELPGAEGVCELQKMYCYPRARGTGVSHDLMDLALDYAKGFYRQCYLETMCNMTAAMKFYGKYGFRPLDAPMGRTGHFGCDRWYILDLHSDKEK